MPAVEVDVARRRLLEGRAARLAEQLEGGQRMRELAHAGLAARVVLVQVVHQGARERRARAQLGEQQLGLLAVVALLGELVDVEQDRPQRREVGRHRAAARLRQHQQQGLQQGDQREVLAAKDPECLAHRLSSGAGNRRQTRIDRKSVV